MPLSEYEQHVIEELEHELRSGAADDTYRITRSLRWRLARSRVQGSLAGLLGVALIACGLGVADAVGTAIAVIGFALVVAVASIAAARRRRSAPGRHGRLVVGVLRALRRYRPGPSLD